jgi:hypothetical protein
MRRLCLNRFVPILLLMQSGGTCFSADSTISWRFGSGLSYRTMGKTQFSTGSMSGTVALPSLLPASTINQPFGPSTGFADRSYNDGFVFRDINTTNPGAFLPGTTAFWGYTNAGQVTGGNLVFTGTGTSSMFSQSITASGSTSWSDREGAVSPSVEIAGLVDVGHGWHLGASLGFNTFRTAMSATVSNFGAVQQWQSFANTAVDTYALQGVVPPAAPYAGVFNPSGPAPVIDNVPTSRVLTSTLTGSQTAVFSNTIQESLELDFYAISLGPVADFERGRWALGGSLGFAMNLVNWRARTTEDLTGVSGGVTTPAGRWESENSGVEVLGGLYLQWQVSYALTERVRLTAFGRHDWMNSLSAQVGPSSFHSRLDGFTCGAVLQFRF